MIKTIIMLTGEFDIPFAKHDSAWSGVVLVIFVFLMVIVFMSMLNGLAISDATEILSKAELHGLIHRLYQVAYFENIVCTIGELPKKYFGNLISDIFLFPQLEDSIILDRVSCKIYDSKLKYLLSKFYLKMDYNIFKQVKQIILNLSKNQFSNNDGITNAEMDYDILKQAKQIILNKNLLLDNDRIMNALSKLQDAMGIE
ncbi:PREDICTED: uncharacterized protein LOC105453869 [Wasmannia auropunctata]|uniref:uncharacterized protein LOC105453869 n=1 Tax=Wasmannia auropunctata TaxID=64793 RepID=UPI0005EE45B5|nr:PREDICTED: uncharacterized protein LOC105453869 [Wasmannia auropunctata]